MADNFNADSSGAYGAMGYIAGIAKSVNTAAYLDSVVTYTHATLATFFDNWLDALARTSPREFQHVYEWPNDFRQYEQTVGMPTARLWRHTLKGGSGTREASFRFMPSKTFVPVDPLLLSPNPRTGRVVKENVHIFELKAAAMEYGLGISLRPKLAKYLAFPSGNVRPMFTKGPVNYTAGGGVTKGKFTAAYLAWWTTQAPQHFDKDIRPVLEKGLVDQAAMGEAIAMGGRVSTKNVSIGATAERNAANFNKAEALAKSKMKANQEKYINAAAARRFELYGE
jgi:hypothetical protein